MKKKKIVLILLIVLIVALDLFVIGLAIKEYRDTGTVEKNTVTRAALILAGSVLTLARALTPRTSKHNAAFYRHHFGHLIGNAFQNDPKREKAFVRALDAYNTNNNRKAIKLLERMAPELESAADRFAVSAFLGLAYSEILYHGKAIEWYERASLYSTNATVLSNLGICYQRVGQHSRAMECYQRAVQADPEYANAYNNMAHLCIREGEYESALAYAEKALSLDANLLPAHSANAISNAMLGNDEAYEKALRRAVAAGGDRKRIESVVNSMRNESDTES